MLKLLWIHNTLTMLLRHFIINKRTDTKNWRQFVKLFSSTTTTTFLLFSSTTTTTTTTTFLLFPPLLLISFVFPPPLFIAFPHPTRCFFSPTRFYKRLQTTMVCSFCSNVACSKQKSWFSSDVGWLPCSSAPASPQQIHALVQVLYNVLMRHISISEENKRILPSNEDALLNLIRLNVPYKQRRKSLYKRVVVLLKTYCPLLFNFKLRISRML